MKAKHLSGLSPHDPPAHSWRSRPLARHARPALSKPGATIMNAFIAILCWLAFAAVIAGVLYITAVCLIRTVRDRSIERGLDDGFQDFSNVAGVFHDASIIPGGKQDHGAQR